MDRPRPFSFVRFWLAASGAALCPARSDLAPGLAVGEERALGTLDAIEAAVM